MVDPSSLTIAVPSQTKDQQKTLYSSSGCAKRKSSSSNEKIKTFFELKFNWHFAFLYQILYSAILHTNIVSKSPFSKCKKLLFTRIF